MRITESQLRKIISEEAQNLKRSKRVNESMSAWVSEQLNDAMHEYYSAMAEDLGHERALVELQNEMLGFIEEYR